MSLDWCDGDIPGVPDRTASERHIDSTLTLTKREQGLFMSPESLADPLISAKALDDVTQGVNDDDDEEDEDEDAEDEDDDEEKNEAEEVKGTKAIDDKVRHIIDSIGDQYDSSKEPLPNLPVYHPAFKSIEQCRSNIITTAISILQTAEYKDAETAQLCEQAMALKEVSYPGDRKVALIGDSGTGMLDQSTLSRLSSADFE